MRSTFFIRALALGWGLTAVFALAGCSPPPNVNDKLPTQAEVQARVKSSLAKIDNDKTKSPEEKEKMRTMLAIMAGGVKTRSER